MIKKFSYPKYFNDLSKLFNLDENLIKKLKLLEKKILSCKKKNKKVLIFGNGGSASIASHFSIDLTNVAKVRCQSFSDPSLITCLSNDHGYENWIKKTIEHYADNGDVLILISSSGMSKNIIKAASQTSKKFDFISTFSGFSSNNSLKKMGDLSFWVNSKVYNLIENTHQIWLLSIVDSIANSKK